MICSVCSSNECIDYCEVYDDRYGFQGQFRLLLCQTCGHKFLECEFSPDMLTKLYTQYYPRSTFKVEDYKAIQESRGFMAWFNGEHRSAYYYIPQNTRILDIGCGFGQTLGYHKARGCEVFGVEADENIRRVADLYGFNIHVGLFDHMLYESDFFDYVTMDQVMEHMLNPVETMKGIAQILKPNGCLILSVPNSNGWGTKVFGQKWINWHCPYHVQHFSLKSMTIAAEKAGLLLEATKTITSSEWLNYQWLHLLTYPQMGNKAPFWNNTIELNNVQKIGFKLLNIVHRLKINHIITRIFDAIGVGDSSLYFLRKPLQ